MSQQIVTFQQIRKFAQSLILKEPMDWAEVNRRIEESIREVCSDIEAAQLADPTIFFTAESEDGRIVNHYHLTPEQFEEFLRQRNNCIVWGNPEGEPPPLEGNYGPSILETLAVQAERERCAKLCDEWGDRYHMGDAYGDDDRADACWQMAKQIREEPE